VITIVGDTVNVFMCFMVPCLFYIYTNMKAMNNTNFFSSYNFKPFLVTLFTGSVGLISLSQFVVSKTK